MDSKTEKYFLSYAENETSQLERFDISAKFAITIPVFDEDFLAITNIVEKKYCGEPVLFILVFNTPLIEKQNEKIAQNHLNNVNQAKTNTANLLAKIKKYYPVKNTADNLSLHQIEPNALLLCVDRTQSQEIPYKQGVGLARKIGNDIAAKLISQSKVACRWLFNTDADALLPTDYFSQAQNKSAKLTALIYPFTHEPDSSSTTYIQASELYELSLRHYVAGLRFSGSAFSYHTIASTLAIDYQAYIKVRGFPRRNAGEDFHILNKLRKIGEITTLEGKPIILSMRPSHRVPFGTGPAIRAMIDKDNIEEETLFYSPSCFVYLKTLLVLLNNAYGFSERNTAIKDKLTEEELAQALEIALQGPSVRNPDLDSTILISSIVANGALLALFKQLQACKNETDWQKQVLQGFDALQTLKYIHFLRDNHFPSISKNQLAKYTIF